MGKENEAEVRCVIYTSQIDEKLGKRVEQVPVGAAGGGGVITIGSEPGSTFRLDSNKLGGNHSCRIIFGKDRAIVKAQSSNIFVQENTTHKDFPFAQPTDAKWELVETNTAVQKPAQFGVKVGNHEFFIKNVKMLDVYDHKKLSTTKATLDETSTTYATTLFAMELRKSVAKALRSENAPESIYSKWISTFNDVSKQRSEQIAKVVDQSLPPTTMEIDKKISDVELNISGDVKYVATQLLTKQYPTIKRECLLDRPTIDNTPVLEPLAEMEGRLVSIGEKFTQYEDTQLVPLRNSCDELRQTLKEFRQRRDDERRKQMEWKNKFDRKVERAEVILEGWRKRKMKDSYQQWTERKIRRKIEGTSQEEAKDFFKWGNELEGGLVGGVKTVEDYSAEIERLVREEIDSVQNSSDK